MGSKFIFSKSIPVENVRIKCLGTLSIPIVINAFLFDMLNAAKALNFQVYQSATCMNLQPVTLFGFIVAWFEDTGAGYKKTVSRRF